MDNLKICEAKHRNEECDAVAERLTKDKVVTLDIVLEKTPSTVRSVVSSSLT